MNKIQKQLTDMVFDINPAEISSHIENDSLRQWCQTWGSKMLEIISSIPFEKDDNYEKGYQDGLNADKWIYCEYRLPENEQLVLFSTKTGRVHMGKYYDEENCINCWYSCIDKMRAYNNVVTAWQPLPSIPKEENF